MDKTIKVTISPLGETKVEANGFAGVGCTAATAPIEQALSGGGVAERVFKPEWAATDTNQEDHSHVQW